MTRIVARLSLIFAAGIVIPACGRGGGGGISPGAVPGVLQFLTGGGVATNGTGGKGGNISLTVKNGSDLLVTRATMAAPAIGVPPLTPLIGAHPRHISADTVYTVSAGAHTTTNLTFGDTGLVADDATFPATDLIVDAGVTLTLPANDANPSAVAISLTGLGTVLIKGTLLVGRQVTAVNDGAALTLAATQIIVTPTGKIDSSGLDNLAGPGGNGGGLTLTPSVAAVLQGNLTNSGGAGTTQGGTGGAIAVNSQSGGGLYALGSIIASGGASSAGNGGDAGAITLQSAVAAATDGSVLLNGSITGIGGSGPTQGGKGSTLIAQAMHLGGVFSTAAITVSGGSATTGGIGGDAGGITIAGQGESVEIFGTITGRGGGSLAGVNLAGKGSAISVTTVNANTLFGAGFGQSSGQIVLGCGVDVRGGDGPVAGAGGAVTLNSDANVTVNAAEPDLYPMILAGYALFDLTGGDGTTLGGNGGLATLRNNAALDFVNAPHIGSILNDADWKSKGGNATAGGGGDGGRWVVFTEEATPNKNAPSLTRSVTNRGSIDCSGGDGTTFGGRTLGGSSDAIFLYDHIAVSNFGNLKATGGNGGTGNGGTPGTFNVQLISEGPVVNQANMDVSGGSSISGTGGNSSNIGLFGSTLTTTGNIFCKGGSSQTGTGGNGSLMNLTGFSGAPTVHGTLSVAGGTGAAPGTPGSIFIGGVQEDPGPSGSITY